MPNAELRSSTALTVELDYGQFHLHTGWEDPSLAVELIRQAQDEGGIAQRGGLVVVLSPHQNNFQMPLLIEVWTAEPDSDLDDWQEAFELHLDIAEHGLTYGPPTLNFRPLPAPEDTYHALITGRGFIARGWPGSTDPGDQWRIRLWPSEGPS